MEDDATRAALEAWLRGRTGDDDVTVGEFGKPKSGFSAETLIFDVHGARDGSERLVLRKEVPDPAVYPQQVPGLDVEIDIQYRVMRALDRAASGSPGVVAPVAPLVGYEPDATVLGSPFFVMRYVAGDVPTESPPYTETGFFVDASPADRRRMIDNGLRALAAVHRIDWRNAGLEWLVAPGSTPGTRYQLALWEDYARRELGDRTHPLLDTALTWLHEHLPAGETAGFSWGDPRPGNIIWQDFEVACLTDFEAASITVPEHDLGWWLMFDRTMHPDGSRLPGDPSRDEQRAMYEEHAGRTVGDTTFHEIFAATRYTAIVVRVMNRLEGRGQLPSDHTIWRDNPASTCLAEMLAELT
jgi:aminoglycoside phosphotransferase (APT) family kinase protein